MDDPAANVKNWSFRPYDSTDGRFNFSSLSPRVGTVSRQTNSFLITQCSNICGHVFGDINHDGPWSTSARNIEGLMDDFSKLIHVAHQIVMLGAGSGDADRIDFLKCIGANHLSRHLTSDHHQRG